MKRREEKQSKKKEDTLARNVRKVAKCCVFALRYGSAGSKSRLAKAAGAEVAVQGRDEKLHAAVALSLIASQNAKKLTGSALFLKLGCRNAAVARSIFASQNAK